MLCSSSLYPLPSAFSTTDAFTTNGPFIREWGGRYGSGEDQMRSPAGIALDQEGNVYVADTGNNRIQVFYSNGTLIREWGGRYGNTSSDEMRFPEGIAVDQEGNVYVADTGNNRIQVFYSNGTLIREWGGRYGSGEGEMRFPEGIAVDQEGNVYVADTGNNRIQVFYSNGTLIGEWGGGYGGREDQMRFPEGIAVDQERSMYVAVTGNDRISVRSFPSHISNVGFSSEDGEIYGNDTKLKIEPIYEGLTLPTAIEFLGPNDMLVLSGHEVYGNNSLEKTNKIMRIVNGQMLDDPVLDLGNTITNLTCVCGIAISRNDDGRSYAFVYIYHGELIEQNGTAKLVDRLYRYDIANGNFTNPKVIFEIPSSLEALHDGGKLMIGPDKNVYLTVGDIDGRDTKAQNVKDGSMPDGSSAILRFTPDGDPVNGGLIGDRHPLDKYYAYGIRNSFGLDYDPATGNIWMTDNGFACCDELNLVRPGFNGGWNKIMGFSSESPEPFDLDDLEFFSDTGRYYDPIFEWGIPIGVTDLVFVPPDNKLGKEYEGNLFVADYNDGYLYRFILNQTRTGLLLNAFYSDGVADNHLERLEAVIAKIEGGGITDLEIGPDGLLYIVSHNGKILRLEPMSS
jgi:glucose/arabinose dehydrogenase